MVIAVISRKGGVGKTTTAVNLSAALAQRGKKVLLIDLDSQALASLSLGVERAALAPSVADVLVKGLAIERAVRRTAIAGLDLITASVDLIQADAELAGLRGREVRLRAALAPIAGAYDFVLLDCPSSLSLLPVNAVAASDAFLVPVVPQFLAAAGVQNVVTAAQRMAWDAGVRIRPLGVLLTMVDYRTRATRVTVDQIRAELGSLVFAIEIRINTRLAEAPRAGQTIFQFDPTATGAIAYQLLAEELLLRCADSARQPPA
ncbi:MAG TPA: ParA family protein [Thermoanaerobaculia bacterium]|jgi:chromosome partitioning protein|nr:ParA family protein [Thermoanaerobaculia bacterium]